MTEWKKEHCARWPDELAVIAPGLLMERKNIEEVHHEAEAGMEAYTEYVCDSREISVSEYEMLKSIEEIDGNKAVDAYTMQLIEEGVL